MGKMSWMWKNWMLGLTPRTPRKDLSGFKNLKGLYLNSIKHEDTYASDQRVPVDPSL
jgi:hypothetical protein